MTDAAVRNVFQLSGTTGVVTVWGADTWLGTHLVDFLRSVGRNVYAFSQEGDFCFDDESCVYYESAATSFPAHPWVSDWVVIAVDPGMGFAEYTAKIRHFADHVTEMDFPGQILLVSAASVYAPAEKPLAESAPAAPRTLRDTALAAAENLLDLLRYEPENTAFVRIARAGCVYGSESGLTGAPGWVNRTVEAALERKPYARPSRLAEDTLRTLIHVSDLCASLLELMNMGDGCPLLVNLPGETLSLHEIFSRLPESSRTSAPADFEFDRQEFYPGSLQLDSSRFAESADFTCKHSFRPWLAGLVAERQRRSIA